MEQLAFTLPTGDTVYQSINTGYIRKYLMHKNGKKLHLLSTKSSI